MRKQRTNNEMADLSPNVSIINSRVNGQKTPTKRDFCREDETTI